MISGPGRLVASTSESGVTTRHRVARMQQASGAQLS
jgi:hypothetical protein